MPRKETIVDFDEIFVFAEEEHNIDWNSCCDIFHRGAILCTDEGKNRDIDLEEMEQSLEEYLKTEPHYFTKEMRIGYPIVIDFMKKNNLTEMYVRNDF